MRIAQLAPLAESVPPKQYGGTERIVSYLTEELVRQGHDVTLFASGDSQTTAHLEPMCGEGLRKANGVCNPQAPFTLMLEKTFASADQFDLFHSHLDFLAFPLARRCGTPVLTTLHGRLDLPELKPVFAEFFDCPLISISDAQRKPLAWANWQQTIYHGLPEDLYDFHPVSHFYLAYVGRLTPEKRPDHAIEIAKRIGMPLKIAAKIDPVDREYFRTVIEPLLSHPLVEYLGEVTDAEKNDLIGNAYALLAPFDWPEPFGLVFIEALACGTPVLAYRRGSVPEIIKDGHTGFICDTVEQMVRAVPWVSTLSRQRCRRDFEKRFTVKRMVQEYIRTYEKLVSCQEERSSHPLTVVNF
ncbi:MAG: glycosyltransferase family 4 protein [Nitrospirales bacterium]